MQPAGLTRSSAARFKHGEQFSALKSGFDAFDRDVRGHLAALKGQIEQSDQKTSDGHASIRHDIAAGNAALTSLITSLFPALDDQIEKAVSIPHFHKMASQFTFLGRIRCFAYLPHPRWG